MQEDGKKERDGAGTPETDTPDTASQPSPDKSSSTSLSRQSTSKRLGLNGTSKGLDLFGEMIEKKEKLSSVLEAVSKERAAATEVKEELDLRRMEIITRLLELLAEQSRSVGVLQSDVVQMFIDTGFTDMRCDFFTPEEIDEGCLTGPSEPLPVAIEVGVDDRLLVTDETFQVMMERVESYEMARLLDTYADHSHAVDMAWQIATLETTDPDLRDTVQIKSAAGIGIHNEHAYISDSEQHVIFRISMLTDEIRPFCGGIGKPGFTDGHGSHARFNNPGGLCVCEKTSVLYVCDTRNDAIRLVSFQGIEVTTLVISSPDPEVSLLTPIGICIVRGDFLYLNDDGSDYNNEDESEYRRDDDDACTVDEDDEDDDGLAGGRLKQPALAGITEESESDSDATAESNFKNGSGKSGRSTKSKAPEPRYALCESTEPERLRGYNRGLGLQGLKTSFDSRQASRTNSIAGSWSVATSRRASTYNALSRRTSGLVSANSSRRTSHMSVPDQSIKGSLMQCTEEEEHLGYSLAITSDHCVFMVRPDMSNVSGKGVLMLLAGSPTEYGYKDAERGSHARFSSLKGLICIRNCLFIADHWNNAIRCVNLKTRTVDTVLDFNPCGPVALTVSSSGMVYVLDTERMTCCNILKICSSTRSVEEQREEGQLGTAVFQDLQESISKTWEAGSEEQKGAGGQTFRFLDKDRSEEFTHSQSSSRKSSSASEVSSGDCCSVDIKINLSEEPSRKKPPPPPPPPEDGKTNRRSSLDATAVAAGGGEKQQRRHSTGGEKQQRRTSTTGGGAGGEKHASFQGNTRRQSHRKDRHVASSKQSSGKDGKSSKMPVVPKALQNFVPGASLHPALINLMTNRDRLTVLPNDPNVKSSVRNSVISGSQFHVSVVSSVVDEILDTSPEFFSYLNPQHVSPWVRVPIGTLQNVYLEASGQCFNNLPTALAYWDAADNDVTANFLENRQQLLVGATEFPAVLKVLPPRKPQPNDAGRFRAVSVDPDRVVMADSASHQIFVVNHTKSTKHKIAGCGKAGYLDGPLDVCRMNRPSSVSLDPTTHYIYVADAGNHRIRCIDLSTGFMRTVCGNGVKGNQDGSELRMQSLDSPFDIHFTHPCHLLISCADNSIRRLDLQKGFLETVLVGS
eukprot:TRINITY_DN34849_c0_g1_i1.p1 TRINITY_DN34849_c0_g1~~TRINITY_DN34849_c0_g1_i1.p1  ORF type:complete len:1137 (+),score=277.90 TRINITY_DN34849_c0_g1_i1:167-3577(+)